MHVLEAIFLGIIQGLTEFLPISSSGHLALFEHFLNVQEAGLGFDIILHVGTLVALVAYFWPEWWRMAQALFQPTRSNRFERRLFWYLVLGTIPGGLAGYLLEHQAETIFRSPVRIAILLGSVGILLILAEKLAQHKRQLPGLTLKDALLIGLAQALAIMPGVSRSGITMTTGLFLGLTRETSARFSFLLSTPVIFGAGLLHTIKLIQGGADNFHLLPYSLGFVAAVLSSYLTIKYLLRFLQSHTFMVFAGYRLVAAVVVLVLIYLGVGGH
ncbi:MAG: undecaprenyl-diphosphatase UppP [Desulfobacca sp. 4484_104]|nr:MAG: undecaprenyl-diphosphatase UppP [Desulfobacca sp. 4484_104]RLA89958.1 MAG: undecaprenyl-diphosphatase UppP [Deltaproteobacteria bacterium]